MRLVLGDAVAASTARASSASPGPARELAYDKLVLATGSSPFVPPVPGRDLPGCFVYRTIEDLEAIRDWPPPADAASARSIGGGLLGLEAANALQKLGWRPTSSSWRRG